jgi:hypothetical protein
MAEPFRDCAASSGVTLELNNNSHSYFVYASSQNIIRRIDHRPCFHTKTGFRVWKFNVVVIIKEDISLK